MSLYVTVTHTLILYLDYKHADGGGHIIRQFPLSTTPWCWRTHKYCLLQSLTFHVLIFIFRHGSYVTVINLAIGTMSIKHPLLWSDYVWCACVLVVLFLIVYLYHPVQITYIKITIINKYFSFCSHSLRYSAASVIDTSSKYKFLWKLPLEDVEVVKSKTVLSSLISFGAQ